MAAMFYHFQYTVQRNDTFHLHKKVLSGLLSISKRSMSTNNTPTKLVNRCPHMLRSSTAHNRTKFAASRCYTFTFSITTHPPGGQLRPLYRASMESMPNTSLIALIFGNLQHRIHRLPSGYRQRSSGGLSKRYSQFRPF